jgi:hypothetical protein
MTGDAVRGPIVDGEIVKLIVPGPDTEIFAPQTVGAQVTSVEGELLSLSDTAGVFFQNFS